MLNYYELEQQIAAQVRSARIPGLALAIVEGGTLTYARGFGATSVEEGGTPVSPQTIFRAGSISKPLTGTAIMRLVEAGRVELDRPIRTYLPWFTLADRQAAERVTLRMLLSHTAGLPAASELFGPRDPGGLAAYLRQVVPGLPLVAAPGKVWSYSDLGINLAGAVAEAVTGQPFAGLMHELVFAPLGMQRTTFDPLVALTYSLAQAHTINAEGAPAVQHRFAEHTAFYPSTMVLSSVVDLAAFAALHVHGGSFNGQRLLSAGSLGVMHAPHTPIYLPGRSTYGLTFFVDSYKGARLIGHGGAIGGYGSRLLMAPDQGFALVLLCNRIDPATAVVIDSLANAILDLAPGLLDGTEAPAPVIPDRAAWPGYCGTYLGAWVGLAIVSIEDDHLVVHLNNEPVVLEPAAGDRYIGRRPGDPAPVSVGFVPEPSGPTEYVVVDGSVCRRIVWPTAPIDEQAWYAYEGVYSGFDELTISVDAGVLWLHSRNRRRSVACVPLGEARFACDYGSIEFDTAADGAVTALVLGESYRFERLPEAEV